MISTVLHLPPLIWSVCNTRVSNSSDILHWLCRGREDVGKVKAMWMEVFWTITHLMFLQQLRSLSLLPLGLLVLVYEGTQGDSSPMDHYGLECWGAVINLNQEIWRRFGCVHGVGAGPGALALLRRLCCAEGTVSFHKPGTANTAGPMDPALLGMPQENQPCSFLIPCCLLNPSIMFCNISILYFYSISEKQKRARQSPRKIWQNSI